MLNIRILLTFIFLLLTSLSQAAVLDDLYRVQQLSDKSYGQPQVSVIKKGLTQVLVQVTGRTDVLEQTALTKELSNPKKFLRGFSYQNIPSTAPQNKKAYQLVLEYDAQAVNQFLAQQGFKPLGKHRPALLLWLAIEEQSKERSYVQSHQPLAQEFKALARARGLPVHLPLLDLQDQSRLPLSDLWGLFQNSVKTASARYATEAVLAGRIVRTSEQTGYISWLFIQGERSYFWRTETENLNAQLKQGLEQAAEQVLQPLLFSTIDSADSVGIRVQIAGINNLANYLDVVDYIATIPAVNSVELEQVVASQLQFVIDIEGNQTKLEQLLKLQPKLKPVENSSSEVSDRLYYQWRQ